ncbi:MAG: sulfite exporter TauE/SafE family protein [Rhodospirillales bacterium]
MMDVILPDLSVWEWTTIVLAAIGAGLMRGFSGFGSALLLAPVLSLAVGPRVAVPAIVLANIVPTIQMIPEAARVVAWRGVMPMGIAGAIGVPVGIWMLLHMDQAFMRRFIAVGVIAFALIMLFGWRFRGRPSRAFGVAMGWIGGFLSGAGSIGGPPVILFLLSGPDPAAVNRAILVHYFMWSQVAALVLFAAAGSIDWLVTWIAVVLLLPQIVGTWAGSRLFRKSSERLYRNVALAFLLAAGGSALVL